jgi:hypothetical protein
VRMNPGPSPMKGRNRASFPIRQLRRNRSPRDDAGQAQQPLPWLRSSSFRCARSSRRRPLRTAGHLHPELLQPEHRPRQSL